MKSIVENYLVFTKTTDFNKTVLKYFYERLCLLLTVRPGSSPDILFTSSISKIEKHFGEELGNQSRAFYDEDSNYVVFVSNSYNKMSKDFYFNTDEIIESIGEKNYKKYKYFIPLSDIYHELVHAIQFIHTDYIYTDMMEGADEIFTFFITGQYNVEYIEEAVALWYLARKVLKLKRSDLFLFIRNVIVEDLWYQDYLPENQMLMNIISKKYNSDFKKFFNNMKLLYKKKYIDDFYNDMYYVHNLIFYKY